MSEGNKKKLITAKKREYEAIDKKVLNRSFYKGISVKKKEDIVNQKLPPTHKKISPSN